MLCATDHGELSCRGSVSHSVFCVAYRYNVTYERQKENNRQEEANEEEGKQKSGAEAKTQKDTAED